MFCFFSHFLFLQLSSIYSLNRPGGEAAAVHASQLGAKKVAVIERKSAFGGPTGLTSKAVREAAKRIIKAVEQIGGDKRKQVGRYENARF